MRHDVLAATPRLARGWRMEEDMETSLGRTGIGGPNRLVNIRDRQLLSASGFWGAKTGPNPTDRGKNGSKRHLMVDGAGTPLAIAHTGANCHDSEMAIPLVDEVPPIKQPRGAPRKRPDELLADRAYDAEAKIRKPLRKRGIRPLIAHRNTEHGSGLGKYRYVVEACFDWLFNWRRLRVRYEKRPDIHDAFLFLGCAMICWNRVMEFS
jgi:transposase